MILKRIKGNHFSLFKDDVDIRFSRNLKNCKVSSLKRQSRDGINTSFFPGRWWWWRSAIFFKHMLAIENWIYLYKNLAWILRPFCLDLSFPGNLPSPPDTVCHPREASTGKITLSSWKRKRTFAKCCLWDYCGLRIVQQKKTDKYSVSCFYYKNIGTGEMRQAITSLFFLIWLFSHFHFNFHLLLIVVICFLFTFTLFAHFHVFFSCYWFHFLSLQFTFYRFVFEYMASTIWRWH